jgi:hypothetical protein
MGLTRKVSNDRSVARPPPGEGGLHSSGRDTRRPFAPLSWFGFFFIANRSSESTTYGRYRSGRKQS